MERALRRFTFTAEAVEGTMPDFDLWQKQGPCPIDSVLNQLIFMTLAKSPRYRCFIL
jgi:hypothetical protein